MAYIAPAVPGVGAYLTGVPRVTQVLGDSVAASGKVTAPAAGVTIAALTPGTTNGAGRYSVQIVAGLGVGGTPGDTDNANAQLVVDGTTYTTLPIVGAANVLVPCGTFILTLGAGQAVVVSAIRNATGATVYIAEIIATLIGLTPPQP